MSREPNHPGVEPIARGGHHPRQGVKRAVVLTSLCCLACLVWYLWNSSAKPTDPNATTEAERSAGATASQPAKSSEATNTSQGGGAGAPGASGALGSAAVQLPIDPAMGALVAGLKQLSGTNITLTAEALSAWRTNFQNLVQSGAAAIPALRAFLSQNDDYAFSQEVWQVLGYSSVRLAAIDALRQIGGTEAADAMQALLGATHSPEEIALSARALEEISPGQYRDQALSAAQTGLAALSLKDPQTDVAPLFEVLQHYGGSSVIPELEKAAAQWPYYATIALANLPDNAGLISILRMADPAFGGGNQTVALEMIAQLAATSPEARQFLNAQITAKNIPPSLWPYLSGPLAGDQYYPVDSIITQYPQLQSLSDLKTTHVGIGNQNLYTLPGDLTLTPQGIQQRLALVDELLQVVTDAPAVEALQQARTRLTERSMRLASQTVPGQ